MIDLAQARSALTDLTENSQIPVTARWMKRAIKEIEDGRKALAALQATPKPLDVPEKYFAVGGTVSIADRLRP